MPSKEVIRATLAGLVAAAALAVLAFVSLRNLRHFIWLAPAVDMSGRSEETLEIYFGESAAPDDPGLLDRLDSLQLWMLAGDGQAESLKPSRSGDSLSLKLPASAQGKLFVASQDFGVREKGGSPYWLMYYAKSGPSLPSPLWQQVDASRYLSLDITPRAAGKKVELTVTFNGSPTAGATVSILGPDASDGKNFEGTTDAEGRYAFSLTGPDHYSIRAKHVELAAGHVGNAKYDEARHYVTLTLDVPTVAEEPLKVSRIGQLPTTLTSFGGAVIDDTVYIYGGTKGEAHQYSIDAQNDMLMRMKLDQGQWETIARGPRLQGLAMVSHGKSLYRIGGFEARNKADEEQDLWSVALVARFDPQQRQWTDLPSLPEARSSFDAAVLGDTIYVIGGWAMAGDARSEWHKTAWKLDLSEDVLRWQRIADAPFERRALAVAAHNGRVYAIGGITSGDETTLETDIYDPQSNSWTQGPELVGENGMAGFGAAAFATGGRLYVTTVSGTLQRLTVDGKSWEIIAKTPTPRFFHRMLPIGENRFVMVGGSSRQGRITEVEVIEYTGD